MPNHSTSFKLSFAALLLSTGLGACTMTPVPEATATNPPAEPPATPMSCNASKAQWAIGQLADEALLTKVLSDTGARQSRVLKPGMMVTAIFDGTRVNVRVDADRIVLGVTCG